MVYRAAKNDAQGWSRTSVSANHNPPTAPAGHSLRKAVWYEHDRECEQCLYR
jgi:hypothetical protein